ncbi:Platinum sensitivity protein [Microbotryomycetes sp. JL221]|nr:Platinum sensitivity protein [Microbotryomycetes sp. JL221]
MTDRHSPPPTPPAKRARTTPSPPHTAADSKRRSSGQQGSASPPLRGNGARTTTPPPLRRNNDHAIRSTAPSPQPVAAGNLNTLDAGSLPSSTGAVTGAQDNSSVTRASTSSSSSSSSSSPPPRDVNNNASSSPGSSSASVSSPSSASPHNQRRVKVYRLQDDKWIDLGTGHCTVQIVEPNNAAGSNPDGLDEGAHIIVRKELPKDSNNNSHPSSSREGGEIILRTKVTPTPSGYTSDEEEQSSNSDVDTDMAKSIDIGGYQKQQDTLIVWTELETEQEMALSFATPTGCGEIWDFIKAARKWLQDFYVKSPSPSPSLSSPQPFPHHHITPVPQRIPEPSLGNIGEVEEAIRAMSRTAVSRERTASTIVRSQVVQKLIRIHDEAEDLESLEDLHALCRLMQTIILLNDNVIFELILRDNMVLGVVSILEYDPEHPTMKASYREHLADPSFFTEVVPIRNSNLLAKIHQTHRLHYLKDVVLARVLEDSTFSMLNSAIYFNEVEIVQEIGSDAQFLAELFAIFDQPESTSSPVNKGKQKASDNVIMKQTDIGPQLPSTVVGPELPSNDNANDKPSSDDQQRNAILFLQQFVSMAKNLQLQARGAFYRSLVDKGLLKMIEVALASPAVRSDPTTKSATVTIFMSLVDHDSNNVRGYSLQQKQAGKRPLIEFLIELFHNEDDLGLKAQMSEALRVLVDAVGEGGPIEASVLLNVPPRIRQEDPDAERFLQYFYDHCVNLLFKPILDLPESTLADKPLDLLPADLALCGHLCDLLCFFINHHTFRSKYFMLSTSVATNVSKLFLARHKHMRLAALRVLRATVNKNDDFYNRFLIKNDLFKFVLDVAVEEKDRDNLLRSAALEFFEYVRSTNAKAIINHVMERYDKRVRQLASSLKTFQNLVIKWEQNNEPLPMKDSNSGPVSASMTRDQSTSWARMDLDAEEKYFNDDDDDDDANSTTDFLSAHVDTPRRVDQNQSSVDIKPTTTEESAANELNASPTNGKRSKLEKTKSLASLSSLGKTNAGNGGGGGGDVSTMSMFSGVKRPLVDYVDDDDDDDDKVYVKAKSESGDQDDASFGQGGFIRSDDFERETSSTRLDNKKPKLDDDKSSAIGSDITSNVSTSPPLPPLRKKKEHDDDDDGQLGLLSNKKASNTLSTTTISSNNVKPNSTGKTSFGFGLKSSIGSTSNVGDSKTTSTSNSSPSSGIKIALGGIKTSLSKLGSGQMNDKSSDK